MSFHLIKQCKVKIRKRPALFSSPQWQEKTANGDILPATELWRDQRQKYEDWEVGIWTYDYNPNEEVFGLLYQSYPTPYAYYIDDVILDLRARAVEGMYFDAGTSCSELYVEPEEWKRVLKELDIMSRYSTVQSRIQEEAKTS